MVTVTVNGKEVTVEDGTLILDAAKKAGIEIPTFCYQADLSGLGSCRMCIVEIEGQRKLQPSCVTPVINGMGIRTDSPQVVSARAGMLEFLLSNHAMDCPVCDKGGECELQNMVYEHGPRRGRFGETKHRWHDKDYILSPVIIKNSNRCVQCIRCVRVCGEIVGRSVLGVVGRGHEQEETSILRSPLDCDHDGNCIEVCPVGCFMRLPYRYRSRPWDLTSAGTVCPYCGTGCRMTIQERDGEVLRSVATPGVGINSVTLCARGRFGFDFVNSQERVTEPLVRRGKRLVPVSWQEALDVVKEGLQDGERSGGVASARLTNEELYLFQKLMRGVVKTRNIDSTSRWDSSVVEGFVSASGIHEGGSAVSECMNSDAVLIIGSQVSDENPVTDYIIRRIASKGRTSVIIASPRAMKLDSSANVTLRHAPAAEGSLLDAITLLIHKETKGKLSSVKGIDAVAKGSLEALSGSSGIAESELVPVSKRLLGSDSISIMAGAEFLRFPEGIKALALLKDSLRALGKEVKVLPVLDRCNQRGAWDMGVHPHFGPGYEKGQSGPDTKGLGFHAMLEGIEKGDIDALYVVGEDVVSMYPDEGFIKEAFKKLKCLVVQTSFMTETARMANVVLPSAVFSEKSGTFTNQEGRVQKISPLLPPPGGSKTDLEIIATLGASIDAGFGPADSDSVFEEIKSTVKMYEDIEFRYESMYPLVNASSAKLNGIGAVPGVSRKASGEGEFLLITGNHLFHSGRSSRRSPILNRLLGEAVVEISLEDAERLGLAGGDRVRVKGGNYEAELTLRTRQGSRKGVAFIPENFEEVPVNRFFAGKEGIPRVSITKS